MSSYSSLQQTWTKWWNRSKRTKNVEIIKAERKFTKNISKVTFTSRSESAIKCKLNPLDVGVTEDVWKSLTFLPTWEVKVRRRGGSGRVDGALNRWEDWQVDWQVVISRGWGGQVSHVTSDADKTGLNNKTCSVRRALVWQRPLVRLTLPSCCVTLPSLGAERFPIHLPLCLFD